MWKHYGRLIDQLNESTDFDMLYEAAGLLAAYGFMGEADRIYETLLLHLPDEAQLKIDRAGTLLELGEEDEALLLLTDVGPDDEEYVQALLALADYYQMSGMAEAALVKIKEAHALVPYEPVIRFAYAELLLDSGKYGEAARLYLDLHEETDEIGGISILQGLRKRIVQGRLTKKQFLIMRKCWKRIFYQIHCSERHLPITKVVMLKEQSHS